MARVISRSYHVIPTDAGWVIRKEGSKRFRGRVFSTQKAAVEAARAVVQRAPAGQIVIHLRNGSYRITDIHGLPEFRRSRDKSTIGRLNIKRAISAVIREDLLKDD